MKTIKIYTVALAVFFTLSASAKNSFDNDIEQLAEIVETVSSKTFRKVRTVRKHYIRFLNIARSMQMHQAEALRYKYEVMPYNDAQVDQFNAIVLKSSQTEVSIKNWENNDTFLSEYMAFYTMIPTEEYMLDFNEQSVFSQDMINKELRKLTISRNTRLGFGYDEYKVDTLAKLLLLAVLGAKDFFNPDVYFRNGTGAINFSDTLKDLVDSVDKVKNKNQSLALFHVFYTIENSDMYRSRVNQKLLSQLMSDVGNLVDCKSNIEKKFMAKENN